MLGLGCRFARGTPNALFGDCWGDGGDLFGDGLGLREEEQVVRAAGLGVGAAHVEAAEGVGSYHGAGALAVEVEVAGLELVAGAIELLAGGGVEGAGEAVLGVVGDLESFVEAGGLDDREHGAEDLLLREAGGGGDV